MLAEVLCAAPAAAHRAARRAARRCRARELAELIVRRDDLTYRYTLSPAWSKTTQTAARGQGAFRRPVVEVGRLLGRVPYTSSSTAVAHAREPAEGG